MESFRIDGNSARDYTIGVEEVFDLTPDLVKTLLDIDLQTFAESTFSQYTAAAFLKFGRVFLLRADEVVIGTCVCFRSWDRPNEVLLMSMGIRPGWRGRGLGQRFVTGVLDRLRARGIRNVSLLVGADNRRALKVYTDVGFRAIEEREVDPQNGDVLVVMRAVLQEDAAVIELHNSVSAGVSAGVAAGVAATVPPVAVPGLGASPAALASVSTTPVPGPNASARTRGRETP